MRLGGNSLRSKFGNTKNPGPGFYEHGSTKRVDRLKSAPAVRIGTAQRRPLIEGT